MQYLLPIYDSETNRMWMPEAEGARILQEFGEFTPCAHTFADARRREWGNPGTACGLFDIAPLQAAFHKGEPVYSTGRALPLCRLSSMIDFTLRST